jgi:formate hydrogenlyase subunit 3/multisubunit Na+/H+ antiporter MnhD subunit
VLRFSLDGLGAVFLALVVFIAPLSAFYSIANMDHYKGYHVARYYPWFLLFIAGMIGLITVTDTMVFFCVFWQVMTIPSFFLIRFEYRERAAVRAANKYLIIMEIACLCIMAGSAVLVYTGSAPENIAGLPRFDFDTLRERITAQGTHPHALFPALALMLVGFGIKAGIWPFGLTWLPDAHPAAPSPVSALLSGVMIKTGVYGIIRTFFWLVPRADSMGFSPEFWGVLLAVVGTVTLVVGTFQALAQEETKRLLAFHSIGQVGYIILGLGVALVAIPHGASAGQLATIALVGALFHTVNHALFKSLLFFNAGTILKATGTQDLNRLGGLVKYMPLTAITALIASFSIAGVPLFNGFASKWTLASASILGGSFSPVLVLCALFGILTSALTLASFMKFFGTSFLSRESDLVKASVAAHRDAPFSMQAPQVILALACVALGLAPFLAYQALAAALVAGPQGVSQFLPPLALAPDAALVGLSPIGGASRYAPLILAGVFLGLALVAMVWARLGGAKKRPAPVWLCGYEPEADRHRYGAHNLYTEVKHLFHRRKAASKDTHEGA